MVQLRALENVFNRRDSSGFLRFVLRHHPPSRKQQNLATDGLSHRVLMAWLRAYDPDRQMDEQLETVVIMEEITKYLTIILKRS